MKQSFLGYPCDSDFGQATILMESHYTLTLTFQTRYKSENSSNAVNVLKIVCTEINDKYFLNKNDAGKCTFRQKLKFV